MSEFDRPEPNTSIGGRPLRESLNQVMIVCRVLNPALIGISAARAALCLAQGEPGEAALSTFAAIVNLGITYMHIYGKGGE